MNEHDTEHEQWEGHPRHHHGGKRFKVRQRLPGPPGFPPMPGFGGPGGEADFGPGPGFRDRGYGPGDMGPFFYARAHGGPPFGPWARGYGRRGGRAKRGDVRAAALALLAEAPMNGYQIIQQIEERSGGLWRPSPGAVYPALAQLEDEGLITLQDSEAGRRAYGLTEAGRGYVAEHPDELRAPWSAMAGNAATAVNDMRSLVRQVHLAAFQVVSAGTDAQLSEAQKVLAQARRALYRILAEDTEADEEAPAGTEPAE